MLLDDIYDHLVANSIGDTTKGGATGWFMQKSKMPDAKAADDQDKVVVVYEIAGDQPYTRIHMDFPTFQVRVRGARYGYEEARAKIEDVFRLFMPTTGVPFAGTINGNYYPWIKATSSPFPIGEDENNRPEIAVNFFTARSRG